MCGCFKQTYSLLKWANHKSFRWHQYYLRDEHNEHVKTAFGIQCWYKKKTTISTRCTTQPSYPTSNPLAAWCAPQLYSWLDVHPNVHTFIDKCVFWISFETVFDGCTLLQWLVSPICPEISWKNWRLPAFIAFVSVSIPKSLSKIQTTPQSWKPWWRLRTYNVGPPNAIVWFIIEL